MTNDDEEFEALYRFRGKDRGQPPLYIGRSKNVMRRVEQHRASKDWILQAKRIDVEWVPAALMADAERQAIQREHPVYNIQHNGARVRFEATAEVTLTPLSAEDVAMVCALLVAGGMTAVWLFDSLANWSVRSRAGRAGQPVELPPARNLFVQDPPHWSALLLTALLNFSAPTAAELEQRQAATARLGELGQGQTPRPQ